jgi:RNase P subunit RPR2
VKENMFSRGRGGIPIPCFKAKGVDTKSETSHTVNDISRKVKKHVSGKPKSSLCRQCAPLVISEHFAVALSRVVNVCP